MVATFANLHGNLKRRKPTHLLQVRLSSATKDFSSFVTAKRKIKEEVEPECESLVRSSSFFNFSASDETLLSWLLTSASLWRRDVTSFCRATICVLAEIRSPLMAIFKKRSNAMKMPHKFTSCMSAFKLAVVKAKGNEISQSHDTCKIKWTNHYSRIVRAAGGKRRKTRTSKSQPVSSFLVIDGYHKKFVANVSHRSRWKRKQLQKDKTCDNQLINYPAYKLKGNWRFFKHLFLF